MITNFQVANFKAFNDLQTIPLKPITIIFGPNSSGKSSVIHSLLLARHGVDTQSLDAIYPSIAGHSVDLGGFRQYIHRRNMENRLQWVAEMNVSSLPAKLAGDLAKADKLSVHVSVGLQFRVSDKENQLSMPFGPPFAQAVEYRIDGETFLDLTRRAPQTEFKVSRLNRDHAVFAPILQAMLLSSHAHATLNEQDKKLLNDLIDSIVPKLSFPGKSDFLPDADIEPELLDSISRPSLYDQDEQQFSKLGDLGRTVRLFLPRMLSRFHSGVHEALNSCLKSLSYLGPLRSYPPRHFAFAQFHDPNWQAGGGYAWDVVRRDSVVRDKVNQWLGAKDLLQTPYKLKAERLYSPTDLDAIFLRYVERFNNDYTGLYIGDELDEDDEIRLEHGFTHALSMDPDSESELFQYIADQYGETEITELVLEDVRTGTTVSHKDVGIGISQVLPVLVGAYAEKQRLLAIEQPEIHLHPRLQAELGDVFIESALGPNRNRFLLETHSEHLILRILRRIRESSKATNPTIKASDVSVLYVEPSPDGAEVFEMEISEDGQILSQWPGGFFPERMQEMFGEV